MNSRALYVRTVGMACPLGLTAVSASAALRAGLTRKQELPYFDDEGRPLTGSFLGSLGWDLGPRRRWIELLALALRDLARGQPEGLLANTPLVCAVPAEKGRPPDPAGIARDLSDALDRAIPAAHVRSVAEGSLGGFRAIAHARSTVAEGRHAEVIVCGADSLVNARALLRLHEQRRLLTADNPDGVIPGEAAAALLLASRPAGAAGVIRGLGFGREPGLLSNDIPLRGDGIVAAASGALTEAGMSMHDMDFRISDAAGESYHFKEQVLMIARRLRQNKESFPLWLCALGLGDTGASAGLCGVVHALVAFRRGHAPGPRALAFAGEDGGGRGALVLERHRP